MALNSKVGALSPFIYGVGTGLTVLVFAVAIALGVTLSSHYFNRITKLEYYTRGITGIIFISAGLYYIGVYILKLF